jgi:hypothetical protein
MFRAPTCRILVTDCRASPVTGQGFVNDCDDATGVNPYSAVLGQVVESGGEWGAPPDSGPGPRSSR